MLRKGVFCQSVAKEMVVFTEDGDSVFTVNESGALILQNIALGTSIKQIAQQLSALYGDSTEVCEEVVNKFVDCLQQEGLCDASGTI
jgi:hypothetical protein